MVKCSDLCSVFQAPGGRGGWSWKRDHQSVKRAAAFSDWFSHGKPFYCLFARNNKTCRRSAEKFSICSKETLSSRRRSKRDGRGHNRTETNPSDPPLTRLIWFLFLSEEPLSSGRKLWDIYIPFSDFNTNTFLYIEFHHVKRGQAVKTDWGK